MLVYCEFISAAMNRNPHRHHRLDPNPWTLSAHLSA